MGRGEPGIVPSLTTQLPYFRQEMQIRQPRGFPGEKQNQPAVIRTGWRSKSPALDESNIGAPAYSRPSGAVAARQ
jgi:hypothetical protein